MPIPILVYRDRLLPRSEVQFLHRTYAGFSALKPFWIGCHKDQSGFDTLAPNASLIGESAWQRFLFKQGGIIPAVPDFAALAPRLIHAHFGRGGALALPLARKLNIPLVVTFHGADASKNKHYQKRLIPTIFQRRLEALKNEATLFVAVSDHIKHLLEQRGFPSAKIITNAIGADLAPIVTAKALKEKPSVPFLLFVGRFVEKKGLFVLIDALKKLGDAAPPAIFIGEGPLMAQAKESAATVKDIRFLGWCSNEETRAWMNEALALVVPSLTASNGDSEGLPSVIFEAMAASTPVIGSRNSGIAEAIDDGITGLLVPENDSVALAAAILKLKETPSLRTAYGQAGLAKVTQSFNAQTQSQQLEKIFLNLIS